MKIRKILTAAEGKTLEFKRNTSGLKQIMKTIVAFANTAGGVIVIGREDNGDIITFWHEEPNGTGELYFITTSLIYKKNL